MAERNGVASPPDDAGHTGSTTTPDQTMIEHEVGLGPGPDLVHDQQKVIDRRRMGPIPVLIAATILLLIVILLVFMPR